MFGVLLNLEPFYIYIDLHFFGNFKNTILINGLCYYFYTFLTHKINTKVT